ncbi:MAG: MFS transporter [Negativicutes bacterium]|nr:MFS transporter [Negativicutes bacterium]
MEQVNEKHIMRKLFVRITPIVLALYVIAYLDRVNVSFAALTMNKDIGLDPYTYGLGAGIFFWGYFIFGIPSNLMLARVGARPWISLILFVWGLVATGMAWVQGPNSFLMMRFILGAAEAGFFPGIILYLTYWFPARYRGRIISQFMLAIPLALAIGSPFSTWLMELDGIWSLKGWQWLFFLQGLPAVLAPIAIWKLLPSNPGEASWLSDAEKRWLQKELESDREAVVVKKVESGVLKALTNPVIWAFSIIYLTTSATNYGLSMFLPQIIKQIGYSTMQTGMIMSIPYIAGCAGMLFVGYSSDKRKERKWHLFTGSMIVAAGLGTAGLLGNTNGAIVAICFGAIGIMSAKIPLWPVVTAYTSGAGAAGAAAGIGLVNAVGNLGGFVGPWSVGLAKQVTGNFSSGLYALAAIGLLGAFLTVISIKVRKNEAS